MGHSHNHLYLFIDFGFDSFTTNHSMCVALGIYMHVPCGPTLDREEKYVYIKQRDEIVKLATDFGELLMSCLADWGGL